MSDHLHQITFQYDGVEDRLLLRINTLEKIEFRLWITRRVAKRLWDSLLGKLEQEAGTRAALPPKAKQAVLSMQHQEAVQSGEFSKTHEEGGQTHPLNKAPLLVAGLEWGAWKDRMGPLTFHTKDGKDFRLNLNEEMLHGLCHLLTSAALRADWRLDLRLGDPAVVVPEKASLLH